MWVYTYVSACMFVECIHVQGYVRVSSCVWLRVAAFRTHLVRSDPVTEDPDPIRIGARYEPSTLAIRRLIHEMIRRSVPVRPVRPDGDSDPKPCHFM